MAFRLTQSQTQSQVFTPQMQQALAMLQAPAMELRTLVQQELSQNPVLEELDPDVDSDLSEPGDGADVERELERLRRMDDEERAFGAFDRPLVQNTRESEERRQFYFDSLTEPESLGEHLEAQLRMATADERLLAAGAEVIGNLDVDGFLRATNAELAAGCGQPEDVVAQAVKLVQAMHPPGVAARDLRECLLLQMEREGREQSLEAKLVRDHLDRLARHRYDEIARQLKVDVAGVREAADRVARLDPKPGRAFSPDDAGLIVRPEVAVVKKDDAWVVQVDGDTVPRLRISNEYKDLLGSAASEDELRGYLKERIRAGKSLIQCIHQRQQTIQKIAEEIVRRQTDFFEHGVSYLRPLTLAQVAAMVGVHETTVSRAIANKYMATPWGVFELKYFFTPGFQNERGESFSNKSLKQAIADLIEGEDKSKPLSDEDVVARFADQGIKLARRTVAKYRAELRILPSHLRRRG